MTTLRKRLGAAALLTASGLAVAGPALADTHISTASNGTITVTTRVHNDNSDVTTKTITSLGDVTTSRALEVKDGNFLATVTPPVLGQQYAHIVGPATTKAAANAASKAFAAKLTSLSASKVNYQANVSVQQAELTPSGWEAAYVYIANGGSPKISNADVAYGTRTADGGYQVVGTPLATATGYHSVTLKTKADAKAHLAWALAKLKAQPNTVTDIQVQENAVAVKGGYRYSITYTGMPSKPGLKGDQFTLMN